MPKPSIRRTMLARRKSLSQEELRSASLAVQRKFLETEEFRGAGILVIYAPIHNEVDTSLVMRTALDSGKMLAFPAVVGNRLVFRQVERESSLKSGAFGIMEPCSHGRVFCPEEIDLFVLPGIAFDLNGERIGYGKGYYDKTLHILEGRGKLVAFCYDFQLVDEIRGEPHDVKMDLIITEKRMVRPRTN